MAEELTIRDIINTMTTAQKNTLCLYVGSFIKEKIKTKPPYAAIESFNEDQRKVFYYLIGDAAFNKSCNSDILEIIKE